jgi:SAM-dependent methyltransferase
VLATAPACLSLAADKKDMKAAAERMIAAAEGSLAPVYEPLAKEIAATLDLTQRQGIGIDLGSGPGTLIVELCRQTKLHWINADINPHFFPYFMRKADDAGFAGRVSAVRADAVALPFRSNYADAIVSRGSFQFWSDKQEAFREILRVLKPGGAAHIGRGLPARMPLNVARQLRRRHGSGPKYDVDETETALRDVMKTLGIDDYKIHRPHAENPEAVNYGIWLEFHKPSR